ncbi:MAG: hypothetical protein SVK08_02410 [Halobacteriota archaeon]|nr:hypothetical protein [Halobacteriota archaeon]
MRKSSEVTVLVTNTGAIYVDDVRITTRGTKWGVMVPVTRFRCSRRGVVKSIISNGFRKYMDYISEEPYKSQWKKMLAEERDEGTE